MKDAVYNFIICIGQFLTIPLALATTLCLIMVGLCRVVHTLVNLAFDREDPYRPLRDLVMFGKGVHDMYAELFNIF